MRDDIILYSALVIVVLAVFASVALLWAGTVAWAWNAFMPLVWKAAPHLTIWTALAFNILVGIVSGIVKGIFVFHRAAKE